MFQITVSRNGAYLNVECCAGDSEWRLSQLRWAGHILATRFAKKNTFDFTGTIPDPELRALLLVQIIDHDLVFDIIEKITVA
jgi:hypothetical protein